MKPDQSRSRSVTLGLAAMFSIGGAALAEPQPEFFLPDVNPDSERAGETISPRQYRQQITAWYFGKEW